MQYSSKNFSNLSRIELETTNGGIVPEALHALGFVMHTNPLVASIAYGSVIAVGVCAAVVGNRKKDDVEGWFL